MTEQSEHLVLDYLRRVGDVAHGKLRADERQDFLRRLRARIEEMRGSAEATEPEQVRKVLARFGDPGALVDRERQRLERERAENSERHAAQRERHHGAQHGAQSGEKPGAAGESGSVDAPEPAAWQLAEDSVTEPLPPVGTAEEPAGRGTGAQGEGRPPGGEPGREAASPADRAGGTAASGRSTGTPARRPASPSTPQALPRHTGPPVYEPRSPRQAGQELPSAASRLFDQLPVEAREALRGGVVEAAGLAFIGLGGVLAPLPLWFIGAIVVALATGWSLQEKLTGLLPPVGLAFVGSVFTAFNRGSGLESYPEMLRAHGWPLFRVGAILGAAYLVFVLATRARRRRGQQPPWRRTGTR